MRARGFTHRILAFLTASLLLLLCGIPAGAAEENGAASFLSEEAICGGLCGTVFFGESTTAHLTRRGGICDTPRLRRLVWRDESGTRMLDRRLLFSPVLYEAENGERFRISVSEALTREHPARIVLSFGLNGLLSHEREPEKFLATYRRLIDGIREHSPHTQILLQSVYPVGENATFSEDVATVNRKICALNAVLAEACRTWGDVLFLDTAPLLRAADGSLSPDCDAGDGIHLTNGAYRRILSYLIAELPLRTTSNEERILP